MSERVEEIRRQWESNYWDDRHLRCHKAIGDLLAALARVRAALDREHICVMEACCNNAVRAALEGRG